MCQIGIECHNESNVQATLQIYVIHIKRLVLLMMFECFYYFHGLIDSLQGQV
jgi:hypothetical protein